MCGIAGEIRLDGRDVERGDVQAMIDVISHRGPDGEGIHLDAEVGLGHRRLSIVDLETGDQPLASADERIWCVFNGEIYDHPAERDRLIGLGYEFHTSSDTEVIIQLYREHGLDFVHHLTGMFGLALWDADRRRLVVVRDRLGIKPIYLHRDADRVLFGSEIKSLLTQGGVSRDINRAGIDRFLLHYYMPGSATLLESVEKLEPGHMLVVENGDVEISRYWRLEVGRRVVEAPLAAAAAELEDLLEEVVADHMLADVPVGFLLSGGLDSSLVVALATRSMSQRPMTFTVGFDSADVVDERPYARSIAERFDCEHHEISLDPDDFWDFLPIYVRHMEEPVCEPPAIALAAVSELAARHVKVVLSGEGGDEAFAGYTNYRHQLKLERLSRALGPVARLAGGPVARVLDRLGRPGPAAFAAAAGSRLEDRYRSRTAMPHQYFPLHRDALYRSDLAAAADRGDAHAATRGALEFADGTSALSRMLQVDTETWLPDDLLVKADKMTMLHSVELRVPLLDHRVLEFAARLPDAHKLGAESGKLVLQEVARRVLPIEIVERPKAGFPVPYERWLRTDLASAVDRLLLSDDSVLLAELDRDAVVALLARDRETGLHGKDVFALIVLELWLREFSTTAAAVR